MYTVVIKLTKEQFEAMAGIIDQGVRAIGLRSVHTAAIVVDSMNAAAAAATQEGVIRVDKVEPVSGAAEEIEAKKNAQG